MKRVRVKPRAAHVPKRHQGETAKVLEEKMFGFRLWYFVQFEDGREQWIPDARVEVLD